MRVSFGTVAAAIVLTASMEARVHPPLAGGREPVTFGKSGPALTYVVLGDSTAAGVGGNYEVGIALSTARELGATNVVTMINLAVSGARMNDVRTRQLPVA